MHMGLNIARPNNNSTFRYIRFIETKLDANDTCKLAEFHVFG